MGETSESVSADQLKDRAVRLFTFLREVVALRTKITRTLDTYEKIIWLAGIPHEPECYFAAWTPLADEDSDRTWIEVKKPRLSPPPAIPEELEPWVNGHQLKDSSKEPEIYERIATDADDEEFQDEELQIHDAEGSTESRFVELADHPDVSASWNNYIANKWRPWAEIDRRKQEVQRLYTDLFTLYQQQKELGESYEVVLGLGQLCWRVPSGQEVNRHLVVAQTALEFDHRRGVITVGPSMEGAKLSLEQDMLEPGERPPADIQGKIESCLALTQDDVWHSENVPDALRSWANSAADGRGEFKEDLHPPDSVSDLPKIALAPALILRRRTDRGFLQLYNKILDDLKQRSAIPKGLRTLVDINGQDDEQSREEADVPKETNEGKNYPDDDEVFFPLPSNEQQRQILCRLNNGQGVLVQGPPGTGKSHTIANLVSHLLAKGKRVLVTSQTPRALRVLKDKIPKEISQLCVVDLPYGWWAREPLTEGCLFPRS
jgi:hypothetical protein